MIIEFKSFHHNNLVLQIIYHEDLDFYSINIHRDNDNSDYDIFGMFVDIIDVYKKFNSIKL